MIVSSSHRQPDLLFPSGIFLIAFSVMAFEVVVARLLAVLLSYHYVFLVLSMALFGLGLGGLIVWFLQKAPPDKTKHLVLGRYALLFAIALPASIFLAIQTGRFTDSLWAVIFIGPIVCTPFAAAGLFMAEMYRSFPAVSHRLYGMDLLGAGAGAWGAVVMLDALGGLRAHFLIAAGAALVALLLTCRRGGAPRRLAAWSLCVLALCLMLAAGVFPQRLLEIPVGRNPEKEIHDALNSFRGEITESRWTAFGRTDLVRYRSQPEVMDLYVDGTAGSPMYRFSGRREDLPGLVETRLADFPGRMAFEFLKPDARDSALLIGPGGGRDVLLALWGGLKNITAVELNEDLVELVRRNSSFNGGIYNGYPDVAVVVDEGRRYLRGQSEPYDLIFLSLPVINTTRSLEGYALTENFLFTLESMREYWERLTGDGSLAVVGHNDAEILRLLALALKMLDGQGVGTADAMKHAYVVASDDYLCLVLRKTAFTPPEGAQMHRAMLNQGFQPASSFFPFVQAVNPSLLALSSGRIGLDDLIRQVQAQGWDIRPVSDNRPFFYKLENGVPRPIFFACGAALILYGATLLIPWLVIRKNRGGPGMGTLSGQPSGGIHRWGLAIFSLLGLGFMLVELSLLSHFFLLLGSPTLAMATVLSALLGWAGLGSWLGGRWRPHSPERRIRAVCLMMVIWLLAYAALLPWIVSRLAQLADAWRWIGCVLLLMPVGMSAGVPFPSAIQWLKAAGGEDDIPWMYAVNGASSVTGSAVSLLLAIHFGFQQALLAGVACYLFVYLLTHTACERDSDKIRIKMGNAALG